MCIAIFAIAACALRHARGMHRLQWICNHLLLNLVCGDWTSFCAVMSLNSFHIFVYRQTNCNVCVLQAQTVANFFLAFDQNLAIVPVLNKIDMTSADPDKVADEMKQVSY